MFNYKDGKFYYEFVPYPKWKFIAIDPYEISTVDPVTKDEALEYLKQHNPNDISGTGDWLIGMSGLDERYFFFNNY